jgi:hypothetical protein
MTSREEPSNLQPPTKLDLVRPDLSAREAAILIREHAPAGVRDLPVFLVAIAGAADANGRLNVNVGGWDVRFALPDPGSCIRAWLFANGNLSFSRDAIWRMGSTTFSLADEWIDSTRAAEAVIEEALPEGMPTSVSVFMQMQMVETIGLFWEVRRTAFNPPMHFSHSLAVSAATGAIVAETFEQSQAGIAVESRHRSRLDGVGEWVKRGAPVRDS